MQQSETLFDHTAFFLQQSKSQWKNPIGQTLNLNYIFFFLIWSLAFIIHIAFIL